MTAINLLTTDAIRQRRQELESRRVALEALIARLDAALERRAAAPGPRAHGTPRRYQAGCRCQPCTTANTVRQRVYRARRATREAQP